MSVRWAMVAVLFILSLAVGTYLERRFDVANTDVRVAMLDPRTIELKPSPIRADWILEGPAEASSAQIDKTHDGSTSFMVWRVGAGRFNWFYDFDETITILDGEVYLTDGANAPAGGPGEKRLGPGDVIFFHDGSTATWRVPDHVRKIATVKRPLPAPLAMVYRLAKRARDWVNPQSALANSL